MWDVGVQYSIHPSLHSMQEMNLRADPKECWISEYQMQRFRFLGVISAALFVLDCSIEIQ